MSTLFWLTPGLAVLVLAGMAVGLVVAVSTSEPKRGRHAAPHGLRDRIGDLYARGQGWVHQHFGRHAPTPDDGLEIVARVDASVEPAAAEVPAEPAPEAGEDADDAGDAEPEPAPAAPAAAPVEVKAPAVLFTATGTFPLLDPSVLHSGMTDVFPALDPETLAAMDEQAALAKAA